MVKNRFTGVCQCPKQLPLNVSGVCRTCGELTNFYDTNTNSCAACPTGMFVNLKTNLCGCPFGQIYTNKSCSCPQDTPYLSKTGCINCPFPQYFNQTTLLC